MVRPVMPFITQIREAIIGAEAVTMNDTVQINLALDKSLERLPGAIRYNLGVDLPLTFKHPKDRNLTPSSTPSFPSYPSRSKVRFIYLNLARKGCLTFTMPISF